MRSTGPGTELATGIRPLIWTGGSWRTSSSSRGCTFQTATTHRPHPLGRRGNFFKCRSIPPLCPTRTCPSRCLSWARNNCPGHGRPPAASPLPPQPNRTPPSRTPKHASRITISPLEAVGEDISRGNTQALLRTISRPATTRCHANRTRTRTPLPARTLHASEVTRPANALSATDSIDRESGVPGCQDRLGRLPRNGGARQARGPGRGQRGSGRR